MIEVAGLVPKGKKKKKVGEKKTANRAVGLIKTQNTLVSDPNIKAHDLYF